MARLLADSISALRGLIAGDGEGEDQGDDHGIDDEREAQHHKNTAAGAVGHEDVFDHTGSNSVGEQGPAVDDTEPVPGEVLHPAESDERGSKQQGGGDQQREGGSEGRRVRYVGGEVDTADYD